MLFFLGYALMYLALMPAGFTGPFHPGLLEALYFSGTSGTTLGFGDIVPVSGLPRILSTSQALFGLVLMTCVLGYVVTLMQALAQRNLTVLTLHGETGAEDGGVGFVVRAAVQHLGGIMERLMHLMAADYLGPQLDDALEHGRPRPEDEAVVHAIAQRLDGELPAPGPRMFEGERPALRLAHHGRMFLAALDRRTDWRRDHDRGAAHVGLR
jgi:hypothetical protein